MVNYVRGEIGDVIAEVLYGASRENKRVVESVVGETLWCRGHDVLVISVADVTVTVMMCCQTVTANTLM